jgi:hypothetical protein
MMFETVLGASLEIVERPASLGYANDRKVETFIADEALQCREDLLVGEVAGGAKEYECVGLNELRCGHC